MKKIFFLLTVFISVTLFISSCGGGDSAESSYYEDTTTPYDPYSDINFDDDVAAPVHHTETSPGSPHQNNNIDTETASSFWFWFLVVFLVILGMGVPFVFVYYIPLKLWYEAYLSGVRPGWWMLIKMRFQKIPQKLLLTTMITAKNAGLKLKTGDMMERYLAGVDIVKVTNTAIRAVNAGYQVSFNELASQFLAKVDVETVMQALITARNADLDVTLKELASQYLAHVDVLLVIEALITAHNAGYDEFSLNDLKEHYLANGNVAKTVDAFVAAKEADYNNITFKDIASIDLAGIDVQQAVAQAINPKVVETNTVTGVAGDGVQLFMKLKLTLRANLKMMIGGATEDTVLARIDESLATEIGRAKSHYYVLENPFRLADEVEKKNLGEGTAYDVISVDVSEIKIGKDVHAELQKERAYAEAETAKANLIKAEEKVQKAMAAAFLNGKLSVHEYHELQNTEADTEMRKKLGLSVDKPKHINDEEHEEEKHH